MTVRTSIGRLLPVLLVVAGATLARAAQDPVRATLNAAATEAAV